MSRPRYYAAAALGRATALRPVARVREEVIALREPAPSDPAPGGIPLPPARLRVLVTQADAENFVRNGAEDAAMIRRLAAGAGAELESLDAILDFGCGCGRVARHWADLRGPRVHGCDYNPRLVRWTAENLPFVEARRNGLEPPAPYPDESLDLIYAISIITHLTEELGRRWLAEWRRTLRPGGLLLFSTQGDAYREQLGKRQRPRYDAGEIVVVSGRVAGMNACSVHHPSDFVTTRLLDGFDLVSFTPGLEQPRFRQDVYLARRR